MEKETEKSAYMTESTQGFGTVKIANDVVGMIAALAATEVDGVSAMVGNMSNELMGMVGMKKLNKGVKAEIVDQMVSVELSVSLEYGYNIPSTCNKVQEKVKNAIETMTGLEVSDVDIKIAGIHMSENN